MRHALNDISAGLRQNNTTNTLFRSCNVTNAGRTLYTLLRQIGVTRHDARNLVVGFEWGMDPSRTDAEVGHAAEKWAEFCNGADCEEHPECCNKLIVRITGGRPRGLDS